VQDDPFGELGLPALAELTDDDVRAAWRRIAAATHPDREDGGDPARFGAAAAAYATLRTSFGRGEALADLSAGAPRGRRRRHGSARESRLLWSPQRRGAHRVRAAAPPARFRYAGGAGFRHAGGAGFRRAGGTGIRHAIAAWFGRAGFAGFGRAGYARYWHAGYGGVDRRLALPAGGAALGAAAAVATVGWTPATIGLVAGALTVTGWGLWRRAWRDR
jgi:curved DNA-binding protein CbpA